MSEPLIHCPLCAWQPDGDARWVCNHDDCGTVWNTFWTRGVCPGCGYQWRNTACHACHEMSPHVAWYHFPPGDETAEESQQEIVEEIEVSR